MRIHELLFEARPENINQPTLDKLFAAYQQKDSQDNNYQSENGLEVAQHIFSAIGPSYLNWVVKQYTTDQHFFLHDLPILSDQINKFVKLTKSPTVNVERDINKYASISDLYTAIRSIDKIENVGSKFWRNAVSGIKEFVSRNEAKLLYESPQYVIYQPLSFESSHFLEGIMTTNLCTIMKNDLFNSYSARGILMYTITQDKMYNCFIATKEGKSSEFSNQHNIHRGFELDWQIQHFPALKPLVKSVANEYSGLNVLLTIEEDPAKWKQICLAVVKEDGFQLPFVPEELRDREIYKIAIDSATSYVKDKAPRYTGHMFMLLEKIYKFMSFMRDEERIYELYEIYETILLNCSDDSFGTGFGTTEEFEEIWSDYIPYELHELLKNNPVIKERLDAYT